MLLRACQGCEIVSDHAACNPLLHPVDLPGAAGCERCGSPDLLHVAAGIGLGDSEADTPLSTNARQCMLLDHFRSPELQQWRQPDGDTAGKAISNTVAASDSSADLLGEDEAMEVVKLLGQDAARQRDAMPRKELADALLSGDESCKDARAPQLRIHFLARELSIVIPVLAVRPDLGVHELAHGSAELMVGLLVVRGELPPRAHGLAVRHALLVLPRLRGCARQGADAQARVAWLLEHRGTVEAVEELRGVPARHLWVQQRRKAAWVEGSETREVVDAAVDHDPEVTLFAVCCHLFRGEGPGLGGPGRSRGVGNPDSRHLGRLRERRWVLGDRASKQHAPAGPRAPVGPPDF
mmetsp:Transcript_48288/g.149144  ORF Transcript_48288/g.149144 Transcript_48288/m.149144 type:complete len:352 (+) Transcript_48288:800-1855(+)